MHTPPAVETVTVAVPRLNQIYATQSGVQRWNRVVDELEVVANIEGGATLRMAKPGAAPMHWHMDNAHTEHLIALLQQTCL